MNGWLLLLIVGLVLWGYYHWFFNVAKPLLQMFLQKEKERETFPDVTVLVCAKNEAENLSELLRKLLNQSYLNYQVMLVNDASTDNTVDVLKRFEKQYPEKLKTINLATEDKQQSGKKGALLEAYRKISSNWVLQTDADCRPKSKHWVSRMVFKGLDEQADIVLGVSLYEESGTWWHKWVRSESILIALQYLGMAGAGKAFMAVGRNLLLHKNIYKQVSFPDDLLSGDDDLLMQAWGDKAKVAIAYGRQSQTETKQPTGLSTYWHMKKRHLATANHYRSNHQLALILWPLSLNLTWLGILVIPGEARYFFCILMLLRILLLKKISNVIYSNTNAAILLIVETFIVWQNTLLYFTQLMSPVKKWK